MISQAISDWESWLKLTPRIPLAPNVPVLPLVAWGLFRALLCPLPLYEIKIMKVVKEESWSPGPSLPLLWPWPVPPPPTSLPFSTQDLPPCFYWGYLHLLPPVKGGLPSLGNGPCILVQLLNVCCSVAESCLALMDCSAAGSSVLHCLREFAQIHVLWVSDAIQPSHPLLLPFPFAFNPSISSLFFFPQWVSSSHQVAKVLVLQHQRQSFQWIFRVNFL